MNKILILLIVTINCFLLINGQISDNNVIINSFSISENSFNLSLPYYQSTTFTLNITTIGGMSLSDISGGRITFTYDDIYMLWDSSNFWETNGNNTMISICVSHLSILGCGIDYSDEQTCKYTITFESDEYNDSYFEYDDLTGAFPNTVLMVYQLNKDPILNSLNVYTHPNGPLITFEFEITYFGSALKTLHFNLVSDSSEFQLELYNFITSNGKYYIEYLAPPGENFTIDEIHIVDKESNTAFYSAEGIATLFNITSIITPKSTPIIDFFGYQLNNISKQYYADESVLLVFDIYLNDITYPLITEEASEMGNCLTFYQNSTFIKLFCTIYPGFGNSESYFRLVSVMDTYKQSVSSSFTYKNLNPNKPVISNITYSIQTIDELKPLFIESNYTFETFGSYLKSIEVYYNEANGNLENLVSGSISNGVVSVTWLLDPYSVDMSPYSITIEDSKKDEAELNFYGPSIIEPKDSGELEIFVYLNQSIIDLTSSSISTVPLLIFATTLDPEINIISSYIDYSTTYNDVSFTSGSINHFAGLDGGLLYNSGLDSVYQTWVSVLNSFALIYTFKGDVNINFVYTTSDNDNHHIYYSAKCLTIIASDIQPTMITNLVVTPQPVSTSTLINFAFETKGDNVEFASIHFYQTSAQSYLFTVPQVNCSTISLWNSTELVAQFACSVQAISLPSSNLPLFFSIELGIRGVPVTIPNYLIRESGFQSYVQLTPAQDYGVPTVTEFQTSFNYTENSITLNYNIDADVNSFVYPIEFHIFDKDQVDLPSLSVQVYSSEGQFTIELCQTPGFEFRYQNIGIYISIKSSINSVYYQFPSQILTALDPNAQNFTLNPNACDFSGPRLVDLGILNPSPSYNTTSQSTNITVYFDITDDLSGFSFLEGEIKSISTDVFYEQIFRVSAGNLVSGNIKNGRYQFDIVIPQYANATYYVYAKILVDNSANIRPYTLQNNLLLSNQNVFVAVSSVIDPNLPAITNIDNIISNNQNNLFIGASGSSQSLIITINNDFGGLYTTYYPLPDSVFAYQFLDFNPNLIPGNYYFSVCLTSSSLSTRCYSWNDLEAMGLRNQITVFSSTNFII